MQPTDQSWRIVLTAIAAAHAVGQIVDRRIAAPIREVSRALEFPLRALGLRRHPADRASRA